VAIAIHVLAALFAAFAFNAVAILLPTRESLVRRALAPVFGCGALATPFFLVAPAPFRTGLAVLATPVALHVLEVVRSPESFTTAQRLFSVLTPFEFRMLKPIPRKLPIGAIVKGAIFTGVGLVVFVGGAGLHAPTAPYGEWGAWPRWLVASAGVYLGFEGLCGLALCVLPPFGWEHAPLQRAPILSRTIAEFWGQRWNRMVSLTLRKNFFDPMARRRAPVAGLLAAFAASAVVHAYIVVPVGGTVAAAQMGAFFVLQGVSLVLQTRLGVSRWRTLLARASTLFAFILTLPLFIEPGLRAFDL
jgi:hypothetical protein